MNTENQAPEGVDGWVTMWPSVSGGRRAIYSPGATKPSYGPELDARLTVYPVYAAPQQAPAEGDRADPNAPSDPDTLANALMNNLPLNTEQRSQLWLLVDSKRQPKGTAASVPEWKREARQAAEGKQAYYRDMMRQAREAREDAQAPATAPTGWVTSWPSIGGGRKAVYSDGAEKPNYGPELNERLKVFPVYADATSPAVGANDARDAARYRWLRSAGVDVPGCRVVIDETVRFLERLDSAIDAGMEGKQ